MKNCIRLAAVAASVLATPAVAQEAAPFGGPRIEATVGWDRVVLTIEDESGGKSGVTYGGEAGFDFALSPTIVAGGYVGIDGSSAKECIGDGTATACIKAGRNLTVGARIGTVIGERALAYVKGGYSNGRISAEYRDTAFPADNFDGGENMDGFHAGAGVQIALQGNFYGKAEYNYTRYTTYELDDYEGHLARHRVLIGFGIGF